MSFNNIKNPIPDKLNVDKNLISDLMSELPSTYSTRTDTVVDGLQVNGFEIILYDSGAIFVRRKGDLEWSKRYFDVFEAENFGLIKDNNGDVFFWNYKYETIKVYRFDGAVWRVVDKFATAADLGSKRTVDYFNGKFYAIMGDWVDYVETSKHDYWLENNLIFDKWNKETGLRSHVLLNERLYVSDSATGNMVEYDGLAGTEIFDFGINYDNGEITYATKEGKLKVEVKKPFWYKENFQRLPQYDMGSFGENTMVHNVLYHENLDMYFTVTAHYGLSVTKDDFRSWEHRIIGGDDLSLKMKYTGGVTKLQNGIIAQIKYDDLYISQNIGIPEADRKDSDGKLYIITWNGTDWDIVDKMSEVVALDPSIISSTGLIFSVTSTHLYIRSSLSSIIIKVPMDGNDIPDFTSAVTYDDAIFTGFGGSIYIVNDIIYAHTKEGVYSSPVDTMTFTRIDSIETLLNLAGDDSRYPINLVMRPVSTTFIIIQFILNGVLTFYHYDIGEDKIRPIEYQNEDGSDHDIVTKTSLYICNENLFLAQSDRQLVTKYKIKPYETTDTSIIYIFKEEYANSDDFTPSVNKLVYGWDVRENEVGLCGDDGFSIYRPNGGSQILDNDYKYYPRLYVGSARDYDNGTDNIYGRKRYGLLSSDDGGETLKPVLPTESYSKLSASNDNFMSILTDSDDNIYIMNSDHSPTIIGDLTRKSVLVIISTDGLKSFSHKSGEGKESPYDIANNAWYAQYNQHADSIGITCGRKGSLFSDPLMKNKIPISDKGIYVKNGVTNCQFLLQDRFGYYYMGIVDTGNDISEQIDKHFILKSLYKNDASEFTDIVKDFGPFTGDISSNAGKDLADTRLGVLTYIVGYEDGNNTNVYNSICIYNPVDNKFEVIANNVDLNNDWDVIYYHSRFTYMNDKIISKYSSNSLYIVDFPNVRDGNGDFISPKSIAIPISLPKVYLENFLLDIFTGFENNLISSSRNTAYSNPTSPVAGGYDNANMVVSKDDGRSFKIIYIPTEENDNNAQITLPKVVSIKKPFRSTMKYSNGEMISALFGSEGKIRLVTTNSNHDDLGYTANIREVYTDDLMNKHSFPKIHTESDGRTYLYTTFTKSGIPNMWQLRGNNKITRLNVGRMDNIETEDIVSITIDDQDFIDLFITDRNSNKLTYQNRNILTGRVTASKNATPVNNLWNPIIGGFNPVIQKNDMIVGDMGIAAFGMTDKYKTYENWTADDVINSTPDYLMKRNIVTGVDEYYHRDDPDVLIDFTTLFDADINYKIGIGKDGEKISINYDEGQEKWFFQKELKNGQKLLKDLTDDVTALEANPDVPDPGGSDIFSVFNKWNLTNNDNIVGNYPLSDIYYINDVANASYNVLNSVLASNGKIYCIPYSGDRVIIIDPSNDTISYIATTSGSSKWRAGIVASNGKIYYTPYSSDQVLIIDPSNDTVSYISGLSTDTNKWYTVTLASNGKIYCTPYSSDQVLIIDPSNDTVSYISGLSTDTNKWKNATLASNGKIYCTPYSSDQVLIIDPSNDTVSYISGLSTDVSKWLDFGKEVSGKIYCTPYNSDQVLIINIFNDTVSYIATTSGTGQWYTSTLASNGKIYCTPYNSDQVLIIDPSNDTVSYISGLSTDASKWTNAVLASNGKIYCTPLNSDQVLIIDPSNDTVSYISGLSTDTNKWRDSILASNDKIYCTPYKDIDCLIIPIDYDPLYKGALHISTSDVKFHKITDLSKTYTLVDYINMRFIDSKVNTNNLIIWSSDMGLNYLFGSDTVPMNSFNMLDAEMQSTSNLITPNDEKDIIIFDGKNSNAHECAGEIFYDDNAHMKIGSNGLFAGCGTYGCFGNNPGEINFYQNIEYIPSIARGGDFTTRSDYYESVMDNDGYRIINALSTNQDSMDLLSTVGHLYDGDVFQLYSEYDPEFGDGIPQNGESAIGMWIMDTWEEYNTKTNIHISGTNILTKGYNGTDNNGYRIFSLKYIDEDNTNYKFRFWGVKHQWDNLLIPYSRKNRSGYGVKTKFTTNTIFTIKGHFKVPAPSTIATGGYTDKRVVLNIGTSSRLLSIHRFGNADTYITFQKDDFVDTWKNITAQIVEGFNFFSLAINTDTNTLELSINETVIDTSIMDTDITFSKLVGQKIHVGNFMQQDFMQGYFASFRYMGGVYDTDISGATATKPDVDQTRAAGKVVSHIDDATGVSFLISPASGVSDSIMSTPEKLQLAHINPTTGVTGYDDETNIEDPTGLVSVNDLSIGDLAIYDNSYYRAIVLKGHTKDTWKQKIITLFNRTFIPQYEWETLYIMDHDGNWIVDTEGNRLVGSSKIQNPIE